MSFFVALAVLCNNVVVVEDIGIVVEILIGFSIVVVILLGVDVDGEKEVVDN